MNQNKNILDFREVDKKDIDSIYELLISLSNDAKRFFHPHPFDKKTITKICTSKKDHYFVMILNTKIIGYSFLRLFEYTIPSYGGCIRRGYERKGFGTLLTIWTIQKAKELGYKKVILKVYKENIIAFYIYKKIGFQVVEENQEKNEVKMEIIL